jgi:hypothetical protein
MRPRVGLICIDNEAHRHGNRLIDYFGEDKNETLETVQEVGIYRT